MTTIINQKRKVLKITLIAIMLLLIEGCLFEKGSTSNNKQDENKDVLIDANNANNSSANSENEFIETDDFDKAIVNKSIKKNSFKTIDGNFDQSITVESSGVNRQGVLLFIHGGGWNTGSSDNHEFVSDMVDSKIAVVRPSYRLTQPENGPDNQVYPSPFEIQKNKFPIQLQDVDCALRWISAKATENQFDINKVYIGGYSAGGHLALLFALSNNGTTYKSTNCPYANMPLPTIKKVVAIAAPTDFNNLDLPTFNGYDYDKLVDSFIGSKITRDNLITKASPITYVTKTNLVKNKTEFLLIYSKEDNFISFNQQLTPFAKKLQENGFKVVSKVFENGDHSFAEEDSASSHSDDVVESMKEFLTNAPIIKSAQILNGSQIVVEGNNFISTSSIELSNDTLSSESISPDILLKRPRITISGNTKITATLNNEERELLKQSSSFRLTVSAPYSSQTTLRSKTFTLNSSDLTLFLCTDNNFANAEECPNSTKNLLRDTTADLVTKCNPSKSCEYICMIGYHYENDKCVVTPLENVTINTHEYNPTNIGYRWEYKKIDGYNSSLAIENVQQISSKRMIQRFIYGGGYQDSLMEFDSNGDMYDLGDTNARGDDEFKALFSPKMLWYPKNFKIGAVHKTEKIKYAKTSTIHSTAAEGGWSSPIRTTTMRLEKIIPSLTVPAGTFTNVLDTIHTETYIYSDTNAPDFEHHLYLAKGVGIIKVTTINKQTNEKVIGAELEKFYKSKNEYFNATISPNTFLKPKNGVSIIRFTITANVSAPNTNIAPVIFDTPNGEGKGISMRSNGEWNGNIFSGEIAVTANTPTGNYLLKIVDVNGKETLLYYEVKAGTGNGDMSNCGSIPGHYLESYGKNSDIKSFLKTFNSDGSFTCVKAKCVSGNWTMIANSDETSMNRCDFLGVNFKDDGVISSPSTTTNPSSPSTPSIPSTPTTQNPSYNTENNCGPTDQFLTANGAHDSIHTFLKSYNSATNSFSCAKMKCQNGLWIDTNESRTGITKCEFLNQETAVLLGEVLKKSCGKLPTFPEAYGKDSDIKTFLKAQNGSALTCVKVTCDDGEWRQVINSEVTSSARCDFLGINYRN